MQSLRPDQSRHLKLIGFDDALSRLVGSAGVLGVETVGIEHALDRFCAARYTAKWGVPKWDVSAMDGYAIRFTQWSERSPRVLTVRGMILRHLAMRRKLSEHETYYVSTGCPLPKGADTVVRVEETRYLGNGKVEIGGVTMGKNVLSKGGDICRGQTIINMNERVSPAKLSVLVHFGVRRLRVYRLPRIGVLSVGDELADFRRPRRPAYTEYNNYSYLVASYLRRLGFEPTVLGVCSDRREHIVENVRKALSGLDLLLTIGGTSVGVGDNTPEAVLSLEGAQLVFHGLRMVPVKPTGVVRVGAKKFVVMLPAHPVSLCLSFHVVCVPLLGLLSGGRMDSYRATVAAKLGASVYNKRNLDALYLVSLSKAEGETVATPLEWSSNLMSNLLRAQGYIRLGPTTEVAEGTRVEVGLLGAHELLGA